MHAKHLVTVYDGFFNKVAEAPCSRSAALFLLTLMEMRIANSITAPELADLATKGGNVAYSGYVTVRRVYLSGKMQWVGSVKLKRGQLSAAVNQVTRNLPDVVLMKPYADGTI